MYTEEHIESSLNIIRKNHPKVYWGENGKVLEMIKELQWWFDEFSRGDNKKPDERQEKRKLRHHRKGVGIITRELSAKYGNNYSFIILEEAERHIREDTSGRIPNKKDYEDPFFWEKLQANGFSSWV
jgi:hypothetical protein